MPLHCLLRHSMPSLALNWSSIIITGDTTPDLTRGPITDTMRVRTQGTAITTTASAAMSDAWWFGIVGANLTSGTSVSAANRTGMGGVSRLSFAGWHHEKMPEGGSKCLQGRGRLLVHALDLTVTPN